MATFRSEFHSVPNTYNQRLTALKKKLTTCFQHWLLKLQQHQRQQNHQRGTGQFYNIFVRADCSILDEKVTYLRKFKRIFTARQNLASARTAAAQLQPALGRRISQKQTQVAEEELQIVARLFSSTLISSTLSSEMTIMDSTYIGVRDEHPEIDAEIRAILLANAQNGITISSIKNEYRQLTGTAFPVHDNITDFLLTIPHVTAECCESGKRIFNIKPTEETRHLHEMILQQRQRESRNNYNNNNNNNTHYNNNNHMVYSQEPPRLWRSQYKRRMPPNFNVNLNSSEKPAVKMAKLQPLATAAALAPNGVYHDNWKHLNNQYQLPQPNALKNSNSINIYSNTLNPAQLQAAPPAEHKEQQQPQQQQQHQVVQQLKHLEEYTHKRRNDFTPTPTTLSCPSQHDSMFTINSDYDAYLLDFPLLGDDFLLYLARMELKCRFKKYEKVLQSGLCISGQTINAARQRLRLVELPEMTQIIVNIGSVDIMRGRPLVQIEHDFRQLVKEMHSRRFVPVLTTLAPLANYRHDKQTCDKVLRLNKFIRNEGRHLKVIDIHSCLINENGVVRFDCFQNGPRSVTGSSEPHVFWNKIGRQRVLQMIEANLEY
ncbi:PREDICTED: maternal effect protein oskar [Drosophila arizonae]|uniref:Maternal effect protein oskar n=1 Tax=Drosophila arizonae TaxID=7263 RepID=A0ABM1NNS5_DROAR|nr:PREDICTED: maternal effect protein oskar [Drosophila arizonae]